jgi:cyclophilin family peptidyl-prolyl cis-trans isomerase
MEGLEDRCLLTAPVLDPISNVTLPANKSLILPLTATDADGNPLTYTFSSSNSIITTHLHTGNMWMQIDVQWTDANNVQQTGQMTLELFNDMAPRTSAIIAGLTEAGFYNNLTFHRIIPNFVIQGGDPKGDGTGGPGFQYDDEFNLNAIFTGNGQLAMANSGPDTNGSQFFITIGPQRSLDFKYSLFGQLVRGFDVLQSISQVPTDSNNKPLNPVTITSASIVQDTTDAVINLDAAGTGSSTITVTVSDGHGGTSTKTFTATAVADTTIDPPFLGPVHDTVVAANKAGQPTNSVSITLSSFGLDNQQIRYGFASPPSSQGTVTGSGNTVVFTPAVGYTGPVTLKVGVIGSQQNAQYDTEDIQIGVGDSAISAVALPISPTLSTIESFNLAVFSNGNPNAKASDFTASINWGDGNLSVGTITVGPNGNFLVTGANSYANLGLYPVQVTILGPLGARTIVRRSAAVNTVSFAQASSSANEGTTAQVTVSLLYPASGQLSVNYAVTGGTAVPGFDFVLANGTLVFQPGQQTLTIPVVLRSDGLANESPETIQLTLSAPAHAILGSQTISTLTINPTDPPPTVAFQATTGSGQENARPAVVAVRLSAPSATPVTVNYTLGGTAVYGTNYTAAGYDTTAKQGTVTFQPGQVVQYIPLAVLDDNQFNAGLTVLVTLSSPSNAVLGTNRVFTYTIQNIDPPPIVTFDLARDQGGQNSGIVNLGVSLVNAAGNPQASGLPVTVSYAVIGGTALGGGVNYRLPAGKLTFPAGTTHLSIPVTIIDNGLDEPAKTVQVELMSPVNATRGNIGLETYTIASSNAAPTVSFSAGNPTAGPEKAVVVPLTVTLSAASGNTVTVDYAVTGGTAVNGGIDFKLPNGTLTFLPGQTSKTIKLTIIADARVEGDQTIQVSLSNPVHATLGTITTDTYTIQDNDGGTTTGPDPRPTVSFGSTTGSGSENAGPQSVTVSLSAASTKPVTVAYAVTGGTAVSGVNYRLKSGSLTFQPGVTQLSIPFTLLDDGKYGPNRTFRVALSAPTNAVLGDDVVFTYTIQEADPAPVVSFNATKSPLQGSETTSLVNLVVSLSAPSALTTTVDYAVTGGSAVNGGVNFRVMNGTLTFLPGQMNAVIPVTVVNDSRNEVDPTIDVTLSNPVNASLGSTPTWTYTIHNVNPLPKVSFQTGTFSTDEAGTPATLAVVLSAPSNQTITVSYAVTGGSDATGTDYSLPANPTVTFLPGQTVAYAVVNLTDPQVPVANETLQLGLSNSTNAVLGGLPTATLTIVEHTPPPSVAFNGTASSAPAPTSGPVTVQIPVTLLEATGQTPATNPGQAVTVSYKVVGGTAQNGVDYTLSNGTLTFANGQSTTQFITITLDVNAASTTDKTIVLQLSSPVNGVLGSDVFYTFTILG